jgi:hypothetical protein
MGEKVRVTFSARETGRPTMRTAELSSDNYAFQLLGEGKLDGRRCFLLSMNPRREEKDLLRGTIEWMRKL